LNFYSGNLSRFQYFDRKGNTHQGQFSKIRTPQITLAFHWPAKINKFSGVPQKRKSDGDSKKIYEHKRKRGFIDSWSKNFDGLHDSSDGMICTYYKKFPNIKS
jgi:hypothetical protein